MTAEDRMDLSELHERLGTAEWCRRLDALQPLRAPLFDRRDALQADRARIGKLWWEWIAECEDWLPPPLRQIREREREIEKELAGLQAELDRLWKSTMEAGVTATTEGGTR